jgi:hypothetical protein
MAFEIVDRLASLQAWAGSGAQACLQGDPQHRPQFLQIAGALEFNQPLPEPPRNLDRRRR